MSSSNVWRDRFILGYTALAPKTSKALRRKLGVAHGVLNTLVSQVVLNRPGIDPLVGEREPTGVPKHVRLAATGT